MNDYTLKFADESTANTILESLNKTYSIDVIGVLYKNEILIDGWHVNVRGPETNVLDEWLIEVKTPSRVWM